MWELNYHHLYLIYVYRHAYICHIYQIFNCINENLLKDNDYCMYLLLISLDNPETVNIMSVGIIGALVGKESLCPWEDPSTSWKKKRWIVFFIDTQKKETRQSSLFSGPFWLTTSHTLPCTHSPFHTHYPCYKLHWAPLFSFDFHSPNLDELDSTPWFNHSLSPAISPSLPASTPQA